MRGLATISQGGSRRLQWSEIGMEDPQEDPLALHCFCVCSGSVLLGDHLGVSRSRKCDLLSVQSCIYPSFLCVFIVSSHSLSMFYSAIIWCTLVALVQLSILAPPPTFSFGRICFVVLVMRKGGESSWSCPWHLGCTSEVFHVHSYQDQFIQPGWAECFFNI